jgi:hypothetical protein
MENNRLYIGIDPGKQGYITTCFNDELTFYAIPMIGKKVYDVKELANIFAFINKADTKIYCVLEDVHAKYGSSAGSTFEFGFGLGLIEGLLAANGIPYSKIQPKKWQKQMFEGVKELSKPSSTGKTMVTDTKAMALIAAKRMFPDVDLRDTKRCTTPHDGKVDSLLMCEYCKRNFK